MNEQETTADIIVAMRNYSNECIEIANLRKENAKLREDLVSPECQVKPLSLDEAIAHADEVAGDCSTACKREHKQLADWLRELKNMRHESGDTAKMREALSAALDMIFDLQVCNRSPIANSVYAVRRKIKAALAEPPRNCDRPECATTKAAQDVWRKEDGGKTAYYEWLLATTTEKKGGNCGRQ